MTTTESRKKLRNVSRRVDEWAIYPKGLARIHEMLNLWGDELRDAQAAKEKKKKKGDNSIQYSEPPLGMLTGRTESLAGKYARLAAVHEVFRREECPSMTPIHPWSGEDTTDNQLQRGLWFETLVRDVNTLNEVDADQIVGMADVAYRDLLRYAPLLNGEAVPFASGTSFPASLERIAIGVAKLVASDDVFCDIQEAVKRVIQKEIETGQVILKAVEFSDAPSVDLIPYLLPKRPLTLDEQKTLLAAIHDASPNDGSKAINPYTGAILDAGHCSPQEFISYRALIEIITTIAMRANSIAGTPLGDSDGLILERIEESFSSVGRNDEASPSAHDSVVALAGETVKPPIWERLALRPQSEGDDLAVYENKEFRLPGGAYEMFKLLLERKGDLVLAKTIKSKAGKHAHVLVSKLPSELRQIIEQPGNHRRGYRLVEPNSPT